MKLLIFSDVHGDIQTMKRIVSFHQDVDLKISLGDSECPLSLLQELDILAIKGNYPLDSGFAYEKTIDIDNHRILLVHGHRHNVQHSLDHLVIAAKKKQCDIVLFGHTHIPLYEKQDGVILLNPGSTSKQRISIDGTYVIMTITKTSMDIQFYQASSNAAIDNIG